jgi:hypothetical protein
MIDGKTKNLVSGPALKALKNSRESTRPALRVHDLDAANGPA